MQPFIFILLHMKVLFISTAVPTLYDY